MAASNSFACTHSPKNRCWLTAVRSSRGKAPANGTGCARNACDAVLTVAAASLAAASSQPTTAIGVSGAVRPAFFALSTSRRIHW